VRRALNSRCVAHSTPGAERTKIDDLLGRLAPDRVGSGSLDTADFERLWVGSAGQSRVIGIPSASQSMTGEDAMSHLFEVGVAANANYIDVIRP
jgi:hypothetical protein